MWYQADLPAGMQENFNETPTEISSSESIPSYLQGKDLATPVMMYCTGGIRCDVYSAHLRDKGFNNLYTLEGGIQNYLREEGHEMWRGSLFVFDGRMAVPSGQSFFPFLFPVSSPRSSLCHCVMTEALSDAAKKLFLQNQGSAHPPFVWYFTLTTLQWHNLPVQLVQHAGRY